MADLTLIKELAADIISALDKHYTPQQIIDGFDEAIDEYEAITRNYNQQ